MYWLSIFCYFLWQLFNHSCIPYISFVLLGLLKTLRFVLIVCSRWFDLLRASMLWYTISTKMRQSDHPKLLKVLSDYFRRLWNNYIESPGQVIRIFYSARLCGKPCVDHHPNTIFKLECHGVTLLLPKSILLHVKEQVNLLLRTNLSWESIQAHLPPKWMSWRMCSRSISSSCWWNSLTNNLTKHLTNFQVAFLYNISFAIITSSKFETFKDVILCS